MFSVETLFALSLLANNVVSSRPPVRSLEVRLTTPITSYETKVGSTFRAVVIAPFKRDNRIVLPAGTIVHGAVTRAKGVGLGLMREQASLKFEFKEYELPDGQRLPFAARVRAVDPRESVTPQGEIKGILAANGPPSLIHGIWHVPKMELFSRSLFGLTGAGGRIFTAYSMGPIGGAGLFVIRCALFRLPEPEIRYPAGTEMILAVTDLPGEAPTFAVPPPGDIPDELEHWLAHQEFQITKPGRTTAHDIINMAFAGSSEDLVRAFRNSGWVEADRKSPRSLSRTYNAYTAQSGYAAAPVSKLLYRDSEPDLVFQKSLNTVSKRHHIRLWRTETSGQEVWLGAATHDVGVEFNSATMMFSHRIHPRIDWERRKVVNDLTFAGCIDAPAFVDRPEARRNGDNGKDIRSDGRLAVLQLRTSCEPVGAGADSWLPKPPMSRAARMARRILLEGRQYVLRGNAYYWGYRALFFHHQQHKERSLAVEE